MLLLRVVVLLLVLLLPDLDALVPTSAPPFMSLVGHQVPLISIRGVEMVFETVLQGKQLSNKQQGSLSFLVVLSLPGSP